MGLEIVGNSIKVNEKMETNIPGVYASGDIVTHPGKIKLISTGASEAAIAVNNAKQSILYKKISGENNIILPKSKGKIRKWKENWGNKEILKFAISQERKSAILYGKAAKESTELSGRFLLEYLSRFERNHEKTLETEYSVLEKYPKWFEDESGVNIMLVGP